MRVDLLPKRFVDKITILDNGCWQWDGCLTSDGYSLVYIGRLPTSSPGMQTGAHRVVYETLVGLIPEGSQLDHLCHDPLICTDGGCCQHRRCVNPAHLQVCTSRENSRRTARGLAAACTHGHAYTTESSYTDPQGRRVCRVCTNRNKHKWYTSLAPEQLAETRRKARERSLAWHAKKKADR